MVLKALPGVGAGLARKLTDHFGTEDRVLQLLADGQTEIIAEVEGVSQKRAMLLKCEIYCSSMVRMKTTRIVKGGIYVNKQILRRRL